MDNLIKMIVKLGVSLILISVFLRVVSGIFFGFFRSFLGVGNIALVIFFVIFVIAKASEKDRSKQRTPRGGSGAGSKNLERYMSGEEFRETDQSLREFFRMNDRLVIKDNLYLRPKDGIYKSLDRLELWYSGEALATVDMLSYEDAQKCGEIIDFIRGKRRVSGAPSDSAGKGDAEKTKAREYIQNINAVNRAIRDEVITAGLNRTVHLLSGIHEMEKNTPDSEKLRKLYDHYLPILMSTLIKFKNLAEKAPLSRDYIDTKSRLAETVHLINEALENISAEYFGGEMTEINVDAKTLQSILKKDGVVGSKFIFPERLEEIAEEQKEEDQLEVQEQ